MHSKVKIVSRANLLKELIDMMIAGKAVSVFPPCLSLNVVHNQLLEEEKKVGELKQHRKTTGGTPPPLLIHNKRKYYR